MRSQAGPRACPSMDVWDPVDKAFGATSSAREQLLLCKLQLDDSADDVGGGSALDSVATAMLGPGAKIKEHANAFQAIAELQV